MAVVRVDVVRAAVASGAKAVAAEQVRATGLGLMVAKVAMVAAEARARAAVAMEADVGAATVAAVAAVAAVTAAAAGPWSLLERRTPCASILAWQLHLAKRLSRCLEAR